jgi:NADH-quinone oxidoreductase subunit N
MLLALGLLVLGSDVLERWANDPQTQAERAKAAGQLTAIGLAIVFVVALVQSRYLFVIGEPSGNPALDAFINLGRNLQAAGPGGELSAQPILGAFATDNLTMISRLTFIGAALLTTLLALDSRPSGNPGEFYSLILFATLGMCLMAASTELILAYLALELSSIALYILAGYFKESKQSVEAGIKYFLFGVLSSGILLYGMSLIYGFTASATSAGGEAIIRTLFVEIANAAQEVQAEGGDTTLLTLGMIFVVAGLGYKIAVVPFHGWSPDVYQGAPTIVTAFISTASKMAGFVLLYRVLTTAFPTIAGSPAFTGETGGWTGLLAFIALITILVGNLSALPQTNAKRLLAYSSIGHAGFLLLAVILWTAAPSADRAFGASSLLYYLITYTATNLGAFGALAVIAQAVGGDELADLNGLARRNLGLAFMLTVLILSLAGIPPLAGFWAKFFVFMTGYQAGAVWLVTVAVLMTVVSLYYYLRFLRAMWITAPRSREPVTTPPLMNATLVITSVVVLLLGLFPNAIWGVLNQVGQVAGR